MQSSALSGMLGHGQTVVEMNTVGCPFDRNEGSSNIETSGLLLASGFVATSNVDLIPSGT